MYRQVKSNIVLKGDLENSLAAALKQLDAIPAQSKAEEIYRIGFRAALEGVATTHGIDMPQVRNAQGEARRAAHKRLPTDDRL